MDDSMIVDQYLSRNEEAIKSTAAKYGKALNTLAFSFLEDHATADECENDTYFAAWNAIPPHEPRDYLFPFLRKITRQLCLNRIKEGKRQKRRAEIVQMSEEMANCLPSAQGVESELDAQALGKAISSFLKSISKDRREVFVRRYWYLESIKSIADHCGISESNTKSILFRTRTELKLYLEKEGYTI